MTQPAAGAGQRDIAFTFPAGDGVTAILINARQLNAGTIQYDGYVRDGQQTLVLDQALVRVPEYGLKDHLWPLPSSKGKKTTASLAQGGRATTCDRNTIAVQR